MNKTFAFLFLSSAVACELFAGVPEVSDVTIAQPRRKTIEVAYKLQNGPAIVTVDFLTNGVSVGADKIVNHVTGAFEKVSAATPKIVWDVGAALPNVRNLSLTAVVKAWALENPPDYMVVELSKTGKSSPRYYPSEGFLPGGTALDTRYRTTHLLMKKVLAKGLVWTMGGTAGQSGAASGKLGCRVTLTNNYYLGVFELTQAQTGNVNARKGRFTTDGDMRPAEGFSFDNLRDAVNWSSPAQSRYPSPPYVDADNRQVYSSIIGAINLCVKDVAFDVPTEAQWEFAARAGQPAGRWGTGDACYPKYEASSTGTSPILSEIARYRGNGRTNSDTRPKEDGDSDYATYDTSVGTQVCGSYPPNAYGFYDMHGNVSEYVLDWWDAANGYYSGKEYGRPNCDGEKVLSTGATGTKHTLKGGSWMTWASDCAAGYRYGDYGTSFSRAHFGARLCVTLP